MARPALQSKVIILLLIFVAYLALRWVSSRPTAPDMIVLPPSNRQPLAATFSLPTLQGDMLHLADLRGQVVLLNFWATWCYPCRTEIPSMNALYRKYQHQPFTIVAVASDAQGADVVAPFAKTHQLTFPILLDPQNHLGSQLNIPGIPTSYLLDKQGRVAGLEVGARDWNSKAVHRLIDTLLAEVATPAM